MANLGQPTSSHYLLNFVSNSDGSNLFIFKKKASENNSESFFGIKVKEDHNLNDYRITKHLSTDSIWDIYMFFNFQRQKGFFDEECELGGKPKQTNGASKQDDQTDLKSSLLSELNSNLELLSNLNSSFESGKKDDKTKGDSANLVNELETILTNQTQKNVLTSSGENDSSDFATGNDDLNSILNSLNTALDTQKNETYNDSSLDLESFKGNLDSKQSNNQIYLDSDNTDLKIPKDNSRNVEFNIQIKGNNESKVKNQKNSEFKNKRSEKITNVDITSSTPLRGQSTKVTNYDVNIKKSPRIKESFSITTNKNTTNYTPDAKDTGQKQKKENRNIRIDYMIKDKIGDIIKKPSNDTIIQKFNSSFSIDTSNQNPREQMNMGDPDLHDLDHERSKINENIENLLLNSSNINQANKNFDINISFKNESKRNTQRQNTKQKLPSINVQTTTQNKGRRQTSDVDVNKFDQSSFHNIPAQHSINNNSVTVTQTKYNLNKGSVGINSALLGQNDFNSTRREEIQNEPEEQPPVIDSPPSKEKQIIENLIKQMESQKSQKDFELNLKPIKETQIKNVDISRDNVNINSNTQNLVQNSKDINEANIKEVNIVRNIVTNTVSHHPNPLPKNNIIVNKNIKKNINDLIIKNVNVDDRRNVVDIPPVFPILINDKKPKRKETNVNKKNNTKTQINTHKQKIIKKPVQNIPQNPNPIQINIQTTQETISTPDPLVVPVNNPPINIPPVNNPPVDIPPVNTPRRDQQQKVITTTKTTVVEKNKKREEVIPNTRIDDNPAILISTQINKSDVKLAPSQTFEDRRVEINRKIEERKEQIIREREAERNKRRKENEKKTRNMLESLKTERKPIAKGSTSLLYTDSNSGNVEFTLPEPPKLDVSFRPRIEIENVVSDLKTTKKDIEEKSASRPKDSGQGVKSVTSILNRIGVKTGGQVKPNVIRSKTKIYKLI